ncbi:unnamed protein product [Bursaphelenchus okinawaensis]|uniref:BED-type domain-containing protein n=1 Tax=Bursaphelenchus okinawaensis TaxID=465554 RepID=A0A811K8H1_9BILA|nr:unnamed protein product [Bursaphelenchus okinawaensis]CAG9093886.1 unnamed protein product [Bursaphelenchus okinawaensis]
MPSVVWNYFSKTEAGPRCLLCSDLRRRRDSSTKTMWVHLKLKHSDVYQELRGQGDRHTGRVDKIMTTPSSSTSPSSPDSHKTNLNFMPQAYSFTQLFEKQPPINNMLLQSYFQLVKAFTTSRQLSAIQNNQHTKEADYLNNINGRYDMLSHWPERTGQSCCMSENKERKPKVYNTVKLDDPNRGKINVELDDVVEEPLQNVVSFVQERYPGFFDCPEKCERFEFVNGIEEYSQEDGFPAVLDLSSYYGDSKTRDSLAGKSIFLSEYERLNGQVKEDIFDVNPQEEAEDYNEIEAENIRRIKEMDDYEIEKARQEIYERLSQETIDFLKKRATERKPEKVSLFKQKRQGLLTKPSTSTTKVEDNLVKNLEVISDKVTDSHETADSVERLAMDPMHMDFASKYMKAVLPRQEQNMVVLFEKLKIRPKNAGESDELVELARKRLDDISQLFLEDFVTEQGKHEKRFGHGVNPLLDGAWSLMPIRRVVDAFEKRGELTKDDIEIVTLSILFSVLLLKEQKTLFYTLYTPGEVYVHLAELFLLGPEAFKEETVLLGFNRLLNEYLIKKAESGFLSMKLTKSISGLDAFFPFYEELLKRYTEFGVSDSNFALMLLLPAYMNVSVSDALTIRILLWSEHSEVVRQMPLSFDDANSVTSYVSRNIDSMTKLFKATLTDPFNLLLAAYSAAIENGVVLQERNPVLYHFAIQQLEVARRN